MMSRRILALIDSKDIYGKERANILVYEVLKKNGFKVYVLYNNNASQKLKEALQPFESFAVPFPRNLQGRFLTARYIIRFLVSNFVLLYRQISLSPDYILVPTEIAISYLLIPLLLTKSKVVFRVGDDPIVLRFNGVISNLYSLIWKRLIARRINTFVCITEYIKQSLIASGLSSMGKYKVIYNVPPLREKNQDAKFLEYPFKTNQENVVVFGFIGRIVVEKGLLVLIHSAGQLYAAGYRFKLLVAGSIKLDAEYSALVETCIQSYGLNDLVVFLGEIDDITNFYNCVDVLCVPSIYKEPSGNVIVEAKHFHRASIIFNLGGMPELVTHLQDGYICNFGIYGSLEEALKFYLDSMDMIEKHGKAAKQSLNQLGLMYSSFERSWLEVFK